MFEKDAEEYYYKTYPVTLNVGEEERKNEVTDIFIKGAEFGYNKANEWHYVKDGDLPKDDTQALVLLENKRMKISIFMENKFTVWNKDYDAYTKLYGVIAWNEIVLPELPKESE